MSGGRDAGTDHGSTSSGSGSGSGSSSGSDGGPADGGSSEATIADASDSGAAPEAGPRSDVLAVMERVADWQIAQLANTDASNADTWVQSVFFAGLMATYRATGQAKYLQRVESWGTANNWTLGTMPSNPNDQCASQSYLEVYAIDQNAAEIAPTQSELDTVVASPIPGHMVWSWEDALFMAPPALARLGAVTSQTKYLDAMSTMWWDTTAYLQDTQSGLFWRDSTYFGKTCPNGQKMLWSRGNGWVLAGTARVLEDLPTSHPAYAKFVGLLQQMAGKIAALQRPDGYWSSCLTDTQDYPEPETSGTSAFVYALAWGINHGLLPSAQYGAVAQNGWNALVTAVDGTGRLGWVQPVGAAPGVSAAADTAPYGCGLFLLAGSELAKLPP